MKITKYLLLLFLLCSFGCVDMTRPGAEEYFEISKTMSADNTAAIRKLSSYPINKQIDIYLFGNCCVEGGGGWIGALFTKNGEEKIPFIIKRIEVFPDDIRNKVALIEALHEINRDCHCLKQHPEYIEILENVGERIKTEKSNLDDEYKRICIRGYDIYLKDIKVSSENK